MEISAKKLLKLDENDYYVVDIRDNYSYSFGSMKNSVNINQDEVLEKSENFPKDKKIIVCCKSGIISVDIAEKLCEMGFEAYSLEGGYAKWVTEKIKGQDKSAQIEQSIRKKYHREIWSRFVKAISTYELVKPNDHICVCISGGKDSMLMAKLFQELKRHGKFPFEVTYLCMDPGYSEANRKIIEGNAALMNIPVQFFETDIFSSVYNVQNNPCYLCARMRRGHLYNKAKSIGCNKIALGHHFDDVIETILMGMIYGGQVQTMMPKLHSSNFEGMQLIRPMYFIREADIIRWRNYNDLQFIQCACKFTDTCTTCNPNGNNGSKRQVVKKLIAELAKDNEQIEKNIFRSVENVNLGTIISYKKDGKITSFLDGYDD